MRLLHLVLVISVAFQGAMPMHPTFATTYASPASLPDQQVPKKVMSASAVTNTPDADVPPPNNPPYSQVFEAAWTGAMYLPVVMQAQSTEANTQNAVTVQSRWEVDRLVNGQVITAWLTLDAAQASGPISITLTFPFGLNYEARSFYPGPHADLQVAYDNATRQLHLQKARVGTSKQTVYSYRLLAKALTPPENLRIDIQAESSNTHDVLRTESPLLYIGKHIDPVNISPEGGSYSLDNGRVILDFPAEAVKATTTISAVVYADTAIAGGETGAAVRFDLYPEITFAQPVTVNIDLSGLVITSSFTSGQTGHLDFLNRVTQVNGNSTSRYTTRDEIVGRFDTGAAQITAHLTHFSPYEAGVARSTPKAWKFNPSFGDVSPFRGAANTGFGFSVPPAPDGLAPALSLQYSSAAADQDASDQSRNTMGQGWSMDLPHIAMRTKVEYETFQDKVEMRIGGGDCDKYGIPKEDSGTCRYVYWRESHRRIARFADDYTLNFGGASYPLVNTGKGEYVPQEYAPIRVRRCNAKTPCTDALALPEARTNDYWQIWTTDGSRYTFGTVPNTLQHTQYGGEHSENEQFVSGWYLHRAYSLHRDTPAKNLWSQEWTYASHLHELEEEFRLDHVLYGSSVRADGSPAMRRFGLYVDYEAHLSDRYAPVMVRVTVGQPDTPSLELIRRYVLDYQKGRQLRTIREEYWNGANYTGLPPIQFDYFRTGKDNNVVLLRRMINTYGGEVEFLYNRIDKWDKQNFRVIAKTTKNERGWASYETFEYDQPCFNEPGAPCRRDDYDWSPTLTLLGHAKVRHTVASSITLSGPEGAGVYGWVKPAGDLIRMNDQFYDVTVKTMGRLKLQQALSPTNPSTVLTEQVNEYEIYRGAAWNLPATAWFVAQTSSTDYPAGSNGVRRDIYKRVVTLYDKALQDGTFYGQSTGAREYSGLQLTKASTTTFHMLDNDHWILRPTREVVDSGNGQRLSEMRYFYNATGRADVVQQVSTENGVEHSRDIALSFDAIGNKTSETIYDDFGTPQNPETGPHPNLQNRSGASIYFEYDTEFGLFPVRWINALDHTVRMSYYGVDGVNLPIYADLPEAHAWRGGLPSQQMVRGAFGQPASEVSPIGASTRYDYDLFGRLLGVTQPARALPTLTYAYGDASPARGYFTATAHGDLIGDPTWPMPALSGVAIVARQWPDQASAASYASAELYDGLGRVLQTRVITDPVLEGTSVVASFVQLDPAGRPTRQSVAVPMAGRLNAWSAPNWADLPSTRTQYDALGRAIAISGPDGSNTRQAYDGYNTALLNANNQLAVQERDALGRLLAVKEYTQTVTAPVFDLPAVALTRYGYDAADRLIEVTDALDHRTLITYDAIGQKVGMLDPNMGTWRYAYDARGRLIAQTDALGQQLTFTYDAIDRLLEKHCTGTHCVTGTLARFSYDDGQYGLGQRTGMSDPSGSTTWVYDERGRMIRETHTFALKWTPKGGNGFGSLRVTQGYDDLDRPTWVRYPDGEVVTTTYGGQGPIALSSLQLSDNQPTEIVRDTTYNSMGQVREQRLGNGLVSRFGYYGYNAFAALSGNASPSGLPVGDVSATNFGRLALACTISEAVNANSQCAVANANNSTPYSVRYDYDAIGNITALQDFANNGQTQRFGYDGLNRLISANTAGNGMGSYAQTWQYDTIGNMTQRSGFGSANGGNETYQYNDRLHPHAVTALQNDANTPTQQATYDPNGNMTQRIEVSEKLTTTYTQTWDAENRLIRVDTQTSDGSRTDSEQYFYNGDGERVAKYTAEGFTVYVGELYEETWPLKGLLPTVPTYLQAALVDDAALPTSAKQFKTAAATVSQTLTNSPAFTLTDASAAFGPVDFVGMNGVWPSGWESNTSQVYDCDYETLINDPNGYNHNDFGANLTHEGMVVTGTLGHHQAMVFNTQPVLPEQGPFAVTLQMRYAYNGFGGYGTSVYFAAFKPSQYATPAGEPTLAPGQAITWTRDHISARYLNRVWDSVSHVDPKTAWQNPTCQAWVEDRLSSALTLGFYEGLTPSQFGLVKIYYTPRNNIGTDDETGDIVMYGTASTDPATLTYVRTRMGRYRPRSIIIGSATEQLAQAAWNTMTVQTITVEAALPTLQALPSLTAGTAQTLTWAYGGLNDRSTFELQRATDSGFSQGLSSSVIGTPVTTTQVSGLSDGTTYYYRVRAVHGTAPSDVASAWSNGVSATQDASPPSVVDLQPSSGWQGDRPVIIVTVSDATAGLAPASIEYRTDAAGPIDTQAYAPATSGSTVALTQTVSLQLPFASSGNHAVQFRLCDVVGNCAESAVYPVLVDVDPPTLSNFQPSGTRAYFSPNGDGRRDTLTLSFAASDSASGVATWRAEIWRIDGSARVRDFGLSTSTTYQFIWDGRDDSNTPLPDGAYEARVVVTDGVGLQASSSNLSWPILVLDTVAPLAQPSSLYEPNKGFARTWEAGVTPTVSSNYVVVRGLTTGMDLDSGVLSTTVNGNAVALSVSDPSFTVTLSPILGLNPLTAMFEDAAGNQRTLQRSYLYTTSGPSLISVAPTDTLSNTRPVIVGQFEPSLPVDPLSIVVTVDGVPALGERSATGFVVTPTTDLLGGNSRPVQVVAEFVGASGGSGRSVWFFNIDTEAAVQIESPISGSVLNQALKTIAGRTDALAKVALFANGASVGHTQADVNGHFELSATLPLGNISISAQVTDPLGNTAMGTSAVLVDANRASAVLTALPSLFSPNGDGVHDVLAIAPVSAPPAGGTIVAWALTVQPQIQTVASALPMWGGALVVPQSLTWDGQAANGTAVPDGAYVITLMVTATTSTGAQAGTQTVAQTQQTVWLDRALPSAPVILYPSGMLTTALPAVGGTATPGSRVIVRRDGLTVTTAMADVDASGQWRLAQFPLHAGDNTLVAQAQTAAGLWSANSAPVTVRVPAEPPLIDVGIAPDWAGWNATLSLTATARGQSDPFPAVTVSAKPREHNPLQVLSNTVAGGAVSEWQATKLADTQWCEAGAYCQGEVVFEGLDTLANRGVATTTLTLDYLPPDPPEILLPRSRTWVSETRVLVVGRVMEALLSVDVTTDDGRSTRVSADARGEWTAWVDVREGGNVITATAVDAVGNRSVASQRAWTLVRRDTLPPTVTLASLMLFTWQGVGVPLAATVSDAGLVRQAVADSTHSQLGNGLPLGPWNDDEGTIGQTHTWSRSVGPLSVDGDFAVSFRAADAVGHIGVAGPMRLVVDSVPPQIAVSQLVGSYPFVYVISGTLAYAGNALAVLTPTVSASDNLAGLSEVRVGNVSHAGNGALNDAWTDVLPLPFASNRDVVITALDRSGNVQSATIRVENDVTAPSLSLSASPNTRNGESIVAVSVRDAQSGLRRLDVDVVTDGITQTRIATNTLAPQFSMAGLSGGHVYRWVVKATDSVNNVITATVDVVAVTVVKTYGLGGQRVAVRANGELRWLHGDHLSSVSAETDAGGNVVGRQLFGPYGEVRAEFGRIEGSWGWATHRKTEVHGLTFMRARWYWAGVGRFVQADSVAPNPKSTNSLNRYMYAEGNPIRYSDPSGHGLCDLWIVSWFCGPTPQWSAKDIPVTIYPSATQTPAPTPLSTATLQPTTAPTATPTPMSSEGLAFTRMPIENPRWTQGYGPTSFAKENASEFYGDTSGLHGGIDLAAAAGTDVYSGTTGVVVDPQKVGLSKDASPNLVIETNGYYIVYGHISSGLAPGTKVSPGDVIGSLMYQEGTDKNGNVFDNTHLHLAILQKKKNGGTWRNFNPLYFFAPDSPIHNLNWDDYGGNGYDVRSMKSFNYTSQSFWDDQSNERIGIQSP